MERKTKILDNFKLYEDIIRNCYKEDGYYVIERGKTDTGIPTAITFSENKVISKETLENIGKLMELDLSVEIRNYDKYSCLVTYEGFFGDECYGITNNIHIKVYKSEYIKDIIDDLINEKKSTFNRHYTKNRLKNHIEHRAENKTLDIAIQPDGKMFINAKHKSWPATLYDIGWLYNSGNAMEKRIARIILESLGEQSKIWKDILADLKKGTALPTIPIDTISKYHNKRELACNYYGSQFDLKRVNKETIGKTAILYALSKVIKNESELQKFYDFDFSKYKHIKIYKMPYKNDDLIKREAQNYIESTIGIDDYTSRLLNDAIKMAIALKEKIPLTFHSENGIKRWHDEIMYKYRNAEAPEVKISENSQFKDLTLPDDCIRLTTKKEFIEESIYQDNCVVSYIEDVNDDICSIWSMRLPNGKRNTIEIARRPNGIYYIAQMYGKFNKFCNPKDRERVYEHLINLNTKKKILA